MALARTKSNVNNESFHQRFSELSDEIRIKNKREDRLLEVRLKYYEREKNIRLNIIRKEQYQLEHTRSSLIEQWNRIQQDKQKQSIPAYIQEKMKLRPPIIRLSVPDLFNADWEPYLTLPQPEQHLAKKPITPTKIIRPHSAG